MPLPHIPNEKLAREPAKEEIRSARRRRRIDRAIEMILSRIKPAIKKKSEDGGDTEAASSASTSSAGLQTKAMPKLEEFLERRDYTGAMTLLEFNRSSGKGGDLVDMWLGYCAFHVGDYKRAMLEYEALTHAGKPPKDAYLNLACIFFFLGE